MSIFDEIAAERTRQEDAARRHARVGWCSLADPRTATEYRLAVVGEEHGEVCRELNEIRVGNVSGVTNLRHELIQLAAVAVAWVEGIDAGWEP